MLLAAFSMLGSPSAYTIAMTSQTHVTKQQSVVLRKMEEIIIYIQDLENGVPIQCVKTFRSAIPSVCTGSDIINWLMINLKIDDRVEALHLARLIALHGYIFSATDSRLTIKDDGSFYRFQTPYFWPSNCQDVDNVDYAVYLCKRIISNKRRLQLEEFEIENFTKLQNLLSRKWELIYMQAETKAKVDKKRSKIERLILESQERAFWNLRRPPPGYVNVLEADMKKVGIEETTERARMSSLLGEELSPDNDALADAKRRVKEGTARLNRSRQKTSAACEGLIQRCVQYVLNDPFIEPPVATNPWITDDTAFWTEHTRRDFIPIKQVKQWGYSLGDLLQDPEGIMIFLKFLEKEFSAENLRFWITCQEFKGCPLRRLKEKSEQVYTEFLSEEAIHPINVDSKAQECVKESLKEPFHYMFRPAETQIFNLMKTDSYPRFLKSDSYAALSRGTPGTKKKFLDVKRLFNINASPQKL